MNPLTYFPPWIIISFLVIVGTIWGIKRWIVQKQGVPAVDRNTDSIQRVSRELRKIRLELRGIQERMEMTNEAILAFLDLIQQNLMRVAKLEKRLCELESIVTLRTQSNEE